MDWSNRSDYDRERYQANKRALIAELGGRCAECGSTDSLEFDHIDPGVKEFAITARWNVVDEGMRAELAKCQLLCADCHKRKTIQAVSVDHGGGISGKRNCKCGPCRKRKNEYMRAWKARRRAEKLQAA